MSVAVAVAVEVAVAVACQCVAVGVAVRVAVMVGVGVSPNSVVVKNEMKPSLPIFAIEGFDRPVNLTLYLVLIASSPIGTIVAVSPSQKTLTAGTRTVPDRLEPEGVQVHRFAVHRQVEDHRDGGH